MYGFKVLTKEEDTSPNKESAKIEISDSQNRKILLLRFVVPRRQQKQSHTVRDGRGCLEICKLDQTEFPAQVYHLWWPDHILHLEDAIVVCIGADKNLKDCQWRSKLPGLFEWQRLASNKIIGTVTIRVPRDYKNTAIQTVRFYTLRLENWPSELREMNFNNLQRSDTARISDL